MTLSRAKIISLIGGMTDEEAGWALEALRVRGVVARQAHAQPQPRDWLLDGFVDMFIREGLLTAQFADSDLPKREAYRTYLKKFSRVMCWLNDLERTQGLSVDDRPMLASICARSMAEYFREMGLFRVSTVLSQIDRLPEALDRSFPGYVGAGVLGMIIPRGTGGPG